MSLNPQKTAWGPIIILGSVWGLSEAALGMYLRQCASTVSGSLMTGAAMFFLAAAWAVSPRIQAVAGMVLLASLFKLFDALLLGLPVAHGAVANPIFAIVMEGTSFLVLMSVVRKGLVSGPAGQGVAGGLGALLAVNLFPLVKFGTGIAACVVPGTSYPLSLYYAPIAVALSALTVPAGFWAARGISSLEARFEPTRRRVFGWLSPAALLLCLAALALLRAV